MTPDQDTQTKNINTPDKSAIQNWFNRLYREKGIKGMRNFEAYPVYLDYLDVESEKRLLDVGCGPGLLLTAASERGLHSYGIDFSVEAIRIAEQFSPDSKVLVGTAENMEYDDNTFDYVTCIGVLEHFPDFEKGLDEMKRVSKSDARFCIMVPNSKSLLWKVSQLFRLFDDESNENAYSLPEWSNLFDHAGFEIIEIFRDKWYLKKILMPLFPNSFETVEKRIRRWLPFAVPLTYTAQFIFILKKR